MHEWALAEAVVATVEKTAQKEKLSTITDVVILLGELQQIEQEIFEFALKELIATQFSQLKKAKIVIETEKSTFTCRNCGHGWSFDEMKNKVTKDEAEAVHFVPEVALVHMRCPSCGSPDFDIIKGRGVSIAKITGEY